MIKAYTDLEQSKRLAEILPLDSADCYWSYDSLQGFHRIEWFEDGYNKLSQLGEKDIPCWSLAALLDQLTTPLISHRKNGKWSCYDFSGGKTKESYGELTAVDGCVKLICEINDKAKN